MTNIKLHGTNIQYTTDNNILMFCNQKKEIWKYCCSTVYLACGILSCRKPKFLGMQMVFCSRNSLSTYVNVRCGSLPISLG